MPQLQVRFEIPSTASAGDDGRPIKRVEVWLIKNPGFALPGIQGPQNIETASKRAQAMLAITPQEFLF